MTRYPTTARVFIQHRMHCVGCEMARFETIANACRIYGQPLDEVLAELRSAAQVSARRDPSPRKPGGTAGEQAASHSTGERAGRKEHSP